MNLAAKTTRNPRLAASVLVGLLWCLALLSVVVVGLLHTSRMDLLVVKNYGDRIQAHYLAVAGIEKAKALLYRDARQRSRSASNHTGELYDAASEFRDVPLGRGEFRVFRRGRADENGGVIFGVSDEESRLNVNTAALEELQKIEGMTPDVAAAIIDWRDEDNEVTPSGAEADYYLSLRPPYQPRNGPIQTIRELLLVRGITPALLLGRDLHYNGLLDSADQESRLTVTDPLDLGWAGILTAHSSVNNLNASGDERVNVQSASESDLARVKGLTPEIAKAIVASRGQNRLQTVADLLDVTAPAPGGDSLGINPPNRPAGQGGGANPSGPKVINPSLLMEIADDLTTQSGDLQGVVNINTASLEVLLCLPGMSREIAQAIIASRLSNGFFPNTAALLKLPGMTPDLLKQVIPRLTARSETYRILSEGKIKSTGARQRIEEIVHVGLRELATVAYREDDL